MSTQINCFFQIIDRRLSGSFSQLIVFWFCMKVEIAFSIPVRGMREKYSFLSIHGEVTLATPASKVWILTQKLQHDDFHHWRGVVGLHSQKEISTYLLLQFSFGFAFLLLFDCVSLYTCLSLVYYRRHLNCRWTQLCTWPLDVPQLNDPSGILLWKVVCHIVFHIYSTPQLKNIINE